MSTIDDDELDGLLERWVERQETAAPELRPPEALRRRVARRRRRPLVLVARLAAAAVIVFALVALGRHFLEERPAGPPERPFELVAWKGMGEAEIVGPLLLQARGPKKGGAFAQLLFQHHHPGAPTITSVDVENPPDEAIELSVDDRFRVGLRPARESFVYLFLIGADGDLQRLFPEPTMSPATNPLPGAMSRYVPAEPGWLGVNVAGRGTRLVAIAAREAVVALEGDGAAVLSWLEARRREPQRGVEVVELLFDSK